MAYNYIILSDDYEAALDKITSIKNSFNCAFDEVSYDLEEDDLYSLVDDIKTVSLFDDTKFATVKQSQALEKANDEPFNELLSAMNDVNSENVMVFLFTNGFDDKKEKLAKLKKYASVIDARMKNVSVDEYLDRLLREADFKIDTDARSLLLTYVDTLTGIKTEVAKLICYKKEEQVIHAMDVVKLVPKPLDDNVYSLVEAVLNKDKKKIFECYEDLKVLNVMPSYLVSLLINKFQEMYNTSTLVRGGMSQGDLAELFHVSSGRAYYMMKNAKASNMQEIKSNLERLNQLDVDIKTGKTDQSLGLELYFLK